MPLNKGTETETYLQLLAGGVEYAHWTSAEG